MGKPSAISTHPEQAAIDAAILANHETLQALAAKFNVSAYSLSRRKKALAATTAIEDGDDLQSRSDLLWERSNSVWETSVLDADTKNQIASIQAGLRSLELAHRQAQKAAETAPVPAGQTVLTIEAMDEIIQKVLDEDPTWKAIEVIRQLDLETLEAIAKAALSGGMLNVTVNETRAS